MKNELQPPSVAIDRGLYVLHFRWENVLRDSFFVENKHFFVIEVQRPIGESPRDGEGILVWFDPGSIIGNVEEIGEASCASVKFFEYPNEDFDNTINTRIQHKHGEKMGRQQAYYAYTFNNYKRHAQYGQIFGGKPGNNLPSKDDPLFIPKHNSSGRFICTMSLNSPDGTTPNFTLRACYISETPIKGINDGNIVKVQWLMSVLNFLATDLIILFSGPVQSFGIFLFLLASITKALLDAYHYHVSSNYEINLCNT